MWFIKIYLLLFLFGLSKQEYDLFMRTEHRIGENDISLFCNVTFSEQEFVYQLEWLKSSNTSDPIAKKLNIDNFEYMNSPTRKKIEVVSLLKIAKDENSKGDYICRIRTEKLGVVNVYNKTISLLKSYKTFLPITQTWVKLLIETEGTNIKIPCVYDPYKFQKNSKWYDYYNKSITSNRRFVTTDLFIGINDLKFSDQNLYRCVSPNNEFYTVLIVTKNYKKNY